LSLLSGTRRDDLLALAGLTGAFLVAAIAVDPRGDFPLNDDWGYAPAVRALVEEGTLRFTEWQSMPLMTHALWGALFCLPFGFSFTALRISTLVAAWLGVLALYALLRQLDARPRTAAIGAAALAFNPIYFGLACSFMTDVPFVAALTGATAAWLRATARDDWRWRALAIGLAIWATLNRQLGIALPIAWTIVEALRLGIGWRWVRSALLPAIAVVLSLMIYQRIVDATIGLPALYHVKTEEMGQAIKALLRLRGLRYPLERTGITLAYLGLFSAPILALAWSAETKWKRFLPIAGVVIGIALAAIGIAMPLTFNVMIDFGLGPRTAPGVTDRAPSGLWILVTIVAIALAVALVCTIIRGLGASGIRPREQWSALRANPTWLLLMLTAAIAFVPTGISYGGFFDRYVLLQLPFAIALATIALGKIEPSRVHQLVAAFALTSMIAFSVPATHDYLAWQRARWQGVAALTERDVPRDRIRGGFEVDNWPPPEGAAMVTRDKAPWVVGIGELPGYEPVERIEVFSWLPWSVDSVQLARMPDKNSR
jgi:hypothetical protein